jgi:DNA-directed RNA polymerase II subunit RPB11
VLVNVHCSRFIGSTVYRQLLDEKSVLFAGYRMPHPLQPRIELKVHTSKESTPQRAFSDALNTLIVSTSDLQTKFNASYPNHLIV